MFVSSYYASYGITSEIAKKIVNFPQRLDGLRASSATPKT